jgi:hypothetical protein
LFLESLKLCKTCIVLNGLVFSLDFDYFNRMILFFPGVQSFIVLCVCVLPELLSCLCNYVVVITPIGGRPVHRLRESSLNLCTGRPPISVMIPEVV